MPRHPSPARSLSSGRRVMRTMPCLVLGLLATAGSSPRPLWAAESPGVSIAVGEARIDFLVGGEVVTRYYIDPAVARPYFWPLNGPRGASLTRAWPMEKGQPGGSTDHAHHRSAWFSHGDVIPEGLALRVKSKRAEGVDFWLEDTGHGRVVCTEVGEPKLAADHGRILTRNEWRTADGMKVLDEARTIHLYDLGRETRLLVLDIDLLASVAPITFGDTDEGSLGVRINDLIRSVRDQGPGRIENAEGKVGEKGCWGYPSAWCDFSGPIEGQTVGLAILADPANPSPSCWQVRGYGLMAANPFGRDRSGYPAMKGRTDRVKLPKGEHLRLRYGLLLHPGDAKEGKVAEHFRQFVDRQD